MNEPANESAVDIDAELAQDMATQQQDRETLMREFSRHSNLGVKRINGYMQFGDCQEETK